MIDFRPFKEQEEFIFSKQRITGAFAGKRGGKTESGAIKTIVHLIDQIGHIKTSLDPYLGVAIAPTHDMLRRLSFKKIIQYAGPFNTKLHKSNLELSWGNGSLLYGISADRPERLEGLKANFIWLDEVLQMPEQIFLEALARVADTKGRVWCTGSLGVQYTNPKSHWVYRHFIERPLANSKYWAWPTLTNPYFPQEELERLKDTLDTRTYQALFSINWDLQAANLVYDEFTEDNIKPCSFDPRLSTYVAIDWGWAHKMVCLFIQHSQELDTVFVIDEISSSKMTLEELWSEIKKRNYPIKEYYCDIAGNQEREQTGISNVTWFKQPPRNIHFRYRSMGIAQSISLVRSYIKNSRGQRRLYVDPRCKKLIDGLRNYSYKLKDGTIESELPLKENSDEVDALRYFFGNKLDFTRPKDTFGQFNRWQVTGFRD